MGWTIVVVKFGYMLEHLVKSCTTRHEIMIYYNIMAVKMCK